MMQYFAFDRIDPLEKCENDDISIVLSKKELFFDLKASLNYRHLSYRKECAQLKTVKKV